MTATTRPTSPTPLMYKPRFGGIFWRAVGVSNPLMVGMAGHRWNPIFSVVEHVGRKSGRRYSTPIAARRVADGFVISLAFGRQVDWHRNLLSAGGGTIRWRAQAYPVGAPEPVDRDLALGAFNAVQRLFLRLSGIDNYVRVADAGTAAA